jgi:hypothetical protein
MGKYDKLSKRVTLILDINENFEKLLKLFVSKLIEGFVEYLDVGSDKVILLKSTSKCEGNESLPLWEAIELHSDNLWHFMIKIIIENENKDKTKYICYNIGITTENDNIFILEIFNKESIPGEAFFIDFNEKEGFLRFYDYMYSGLINAINNLKFPLK